MANTLSPAIIRVELQLEPLTYPSLPLFVTPREAFQKHKFDHAQRLPITRRMKLLTRALGSATSSSWSSLGVHSHVGCPVTPPAIHAESCLRPFSVYLKYYTVQQREEERERQEARKLGQPGRQEIESNVQVKDH